MAIGYVKHDWGPKTTVQKTVMNEIESGIKAACDGVDTNTSAIAAHDTAIAAINSNLNITEGKNSPMFGIATGTTSATVGGTTTLSYPAGFTVSNCILIGLHINYIAGSQAEMTSYGTNIDLRTSGIVVATTNANLVSKIVVAVLLKIIY